MNSYKQHLKDLKVVYKQNKQIKQHLKQQLQLLKNHVQQKEQAGS